MWKSNAVCFGFSQLVFIRTAGLVCRDSPLQTTSKHTRTHTRTSHHTHITHTHITNRQHERVQHAPKVKTTIGGVAFDGKAELKSHQIKVSPKNLACTCIFHGIHQILLLNFTTGDTHGANVKRNVLCVCE